MINYGGKRTIYLGTNEPFVIAFREKRSSNSDNLDNIWRALINSYKLMPDGTLREDYAASKLQSDRKVNYYNYDFHNLDGSTKSDISGTYDEWITNYITFYPDPNYPVEYLTVTFYRHCNPTNVWEGWLDNFWIGPADQFDPNMLGTEHESATLGSFYNEEKAADPVDVATGNYTYEHTDLQIPGRGGLPFEFSRYYSSKSNQVGPLGKGWGHTYNTFVEEKEDQSVIVHYPDGKSILFFKSITGFTPLSGVFEEFTKNEVEGTFELLFKNQTKFIYDSTGKINSIVDKNNNKLTFEYDMNGKLSTVSDLAQRLIIFGYDTNGNIETITDPLQRVLTFSYDQFGNLTSVKNLRGFYTYYTYDSYGMTSIKDGNGNVFLKNVYDFYSRVIEQYDAEGNKSTFSYNDNFKTNKLTDFRGNITTYKYNEYYRVVEKINPLEEKIIYAYDENQNRTSITDPKGNLTQFSYDLKGNMLTKQDPSPLNYVTNYEYDSMNNIKKVTDAEGNIKQFNYDLKGNLLTETVLMDDGNNLLTTYTYDSFGQVKTVEDANNNLTEYFYDDYGNKTKLIDPLGNITTATYDLVGRKITEVSPKGNLPGANQEEYTITYDFDNENNLKTITAPLGNITSFEYDGNNNKISMTDARLNTTYYTYDSNNRLKTNKDAENGVTTYEYDPNGNLIKTIDPRGNVYRTVYDELNRPIATLDPLLNTTTKTFDPNGNVKTVADAVYSNTTVSSDFITDVYITIKTESYDYFSVEAYYNDTWNEVYKYGGTVNGWLTLPQPATEIRTKLITNASYQYGWGGDVPEVKIQSSGSIIPTNYKLKILWESNNQNSTSESWMPAEIIDITTDQVTITYDYDELNRKNKETDSLGRETTYTYDAVGNIKTATDPEQHTTTFNYDNAYRLVEVIDAKNQSTKYYFDKVGNKTAIHNTLSNITSYQYDALNRVIEEKDPLNNITAYTYDEEGNLKTRTDANNSITTYDYDRLNRLVSISYPDASTITYDYDAVGNRKSMIDITGTTTYVYDKLNRLKEVTYPGSIIISYAYDMVGNKTAITYPGNKTITYDYDPANRLVKVTDWRNNVTDTSYNESGLKVKDILPNGIETNFNYNSANELQEINSKQDSTILTQRGYTYNLDGNRISEIDQNNSRTDYHYDELHRVTQVNYPNGQIVNYNYDSAGNRSTLSSDLDLIAYNYDTADRLTVADYVYVPDGQMTVTDSVYSSYDGNGNITFRDDITYEYDYENRLIKVITSTDVIEYTYDGDGRRVSKTVDGVTTRYFYDITENLPRILLELDGTGNVITEYINGTSVIGKIDNDTTEMYYLYDGLGSVIAVTDGHGLTPLI